MKRLALATTTLIIFAISSLQPIYAAPLAGSAQPPSGASTGASNRSAEPILDKDPNHFNSLRWMVYLMFLSLPFTPSQTHYAPISIPVHLPPLNIPTPRFPENPPSLNVPTPRLFENPPTPSIPDPKPPVEGKIDEPAR